MDELSNGHWVPSNAERKAFYCCPRTASPQAKSDQDKDTGHVCEHYNPSPSANLYRREGNTSLLRSVSGSYCACDFRLGTWKIPHPIENWRWQPKSSCEVLDFGGDGFCKLLGSRKILFVGDSLSEHSLITVNNMVLQSPRPGTCMKQLHWLVFRKVSTAVDMHGLKNAVLHDIKPEKVIINTGAWYTGLKDYSRDIVILMTTLNKLQMTTNHTTKFIWRSMVYGHEGCRDHLDFSFPLEPISPLMMPNTTSLYNWRYFSLYNEKARFLAAIHNMTF
ncbi:hypothetical protein EON65_50750 [archaeon]|nr:MAG: hypothetical protein EON65_50750 [archaeon]